MRPDHPTDAVIDSLTGKWMPMLIVGGVGIAFLLFTMLARWKRAPRAKGGLGGVFVARDMELDREVAPTFDRTASGFLILTEGKHLLKLIYK